MKATSSPRLATSSLPKTVALALAATLSACGGIEAIDSQSQAGRVKKPPPPPSAPPPSPSTGTGGMILWQTELAGPYSEVRPALGPDGTIYAVDVTNNLYAVSPAGTVKWQATGTGAGNKGVAVGTDGTVYVGSEDTVRAYAPADGTLLWTFVQSPRAFIFDGLSVGPDGNLYCVATSGMGVFSLTPGGALRWVNPEIYDRPNVSYAEIVFGPNGGRTQLYFYANAHVRAVDLDGNDVFTLAGGSPPAVSPLDGSVHVGDRAYGPDGSLRWSFGLSSGGAVDVGRDGVTYLSFLSSALYAVDASGIQKWRVTAPDWLGNPVVDPTGAVAVFQGNDPATYAGVLDAFATSSGARLWRVAFPQKGGVNQWVDTYGRFTPDGAVLYVITAIQTGTFSTSHAYLTAVAAR